MVTIPASLIYAFPDKLSGDWLIDHDLWVLVILDCPFVIAMDLMVVSL